MGKRELLLAVAFAIAGVVVYQLAAPASDSGRGLSLQRLLSSVQRELQGNRANAELTSERTFPAESTLTELRLGNVASLSVTGEDREDVAAELTVSSNGFDDVEARRLAEATTLTADRFGDALVLSMSYPAEGRQRASLRLRVPARLRIRAQGISGDLAASRVAGLFLDGTRGDLTLRDIAGAVEGNHRGGDLELEGAGSLKLTARSSDMRMRGIAGTVQLDMTGGSARVVDAGGAIEVESRSADLETESAPGPYRITASGGRATLRGVASEVRFEGRSTDLVLSLAAPATVTASTRDAAIEIEAPAAGGFTLDVEAIDGRIELTGIDLAVVSDGATQRASGAIRDGGPVVAARVTDGRVAVRAASANR